MLSKDFKISVNYLVMLGRGGNTQCRPLSPSHLRLETVGLRTGGAAPAAAASQPVAKPAAMASFYFAPASACVQLRLAPDLRFQEQGQSTCEALGCADKPKR